MGWDGMEVVAFVRLLFVGCLCCRFFCFFFLVFWGLKMMKVPRRPSSGGQAVMNHEMNTNRGYLKILALCLLVYVDRVIYLLFCDGCTGFHKFNIRATLKRFLILPRGENALELQSCALEEVAMGMGCPPVCFITLIGNDWFGSNVQSSKFFGVLFFICFHRNVTDANR